MENVKKRLDAKSASNISLDKLNNHKILDIECEDEEFIE